MIAFFFEFGWSLCYIYFRNYVKQWIIKTNFLWCCIRSVESWLLYNKIYAWCHWKMWNEFYREKNGTLTRSALALIVRPYMLCLYRLNMKFPHKTFLCWLFTGKLSHFTMWMTWVSHRCVFTTYRERITFPMETRVSGFHYFSLVSKLFSS